MTDAFGDTFTKRVSESPIYNFDFAEIDAAITSLTVPTVTHVKQNKVTEVLDLNVGVPTAAGAVVQAKLSNGTNGELYKLVAKATDQNGSAREMVGWLEVEEVPDSVALIVEDGSAKTNADSYGSLAGANAYFSARRNTTWLESDPFRKESALREATRFIDGRYTWGGQVETSDQALAWPRFSATDREHRVIDSGTVPVRVQEATYEAALLALTGRLQPATDRGGRVKSVKLGPLAIENEEGAPTTRSFDQIDTILVTLYRSAGSVRHQLVRG